MGENQYENFKSGVKRDVQSAAWGLFASIGLFLLALTIAGVLGWFFLKTNHYGIEVKITVGVSVIVLIIAMLTNKQIGNFIYLCWLKLLLIICLLICASVFGLILYCMWYLLKDYF